jgi:hypothetical protein
MNGFDKRENGNQKTRRANENPGQVDLTGASFRV